MQFDREISSGALWLLCADERDVKVVENCTRSPMFLSLPCMIVQFKTSDLKFGVTLDLKFSVMSDLKFDVTSGLKFSMMSDLKFGVTSDFKFDLMSLANLYN